MCGVCVCVYTLCSEYLCISNVCVIWLLQNAVVNIESRDALGGVHWT